MQHSLSCLAMFFVEELADATNQHLRVRAVAACNPCLNNGDRLRVGVPCPSFGISVDHPAPVICAIGPSSISNPLVVTPFNHEHFGAYCNTFSTPRQRVVRKQL
jgi:hypothetical protein